MSLEIGKVYSGFKLLSEDELKEINSKALMFQHEETGAKLLKLENKDDNKVFSIAFRTPPKDSTGVAHILEHSVLCGSRKFPTKEPFVELIKGSLNTFLNAMTFGDKTMYPVASRNKKDFFNLMDVYLDAVLYPNIYKHPEIFMQEGWHYELDDKESDIQYKGVVYNEMKGAYSSPESILMRKISESLFPDTTYGVESGGDPEVIPELSYEEFIDFHKRYYHPSNSYIFLYGDGDVLEELKFIQDNYLKDFKMLNIDSKIRIQPTFSSMREAVVDYPISPNEKEEDKTFLSLNFTVGKSTDKELYLAFDILEHLLLETPAAPLKKALIGANIGKDVFGSFDNSILQPTFSIVVKGSNEDKKDEFKSVILNTLKDLVKNGIDKKLIESSINIKEFALREADFGGYPTGLIYGIKCMDSWLYDENPLIHLNYEPQLEKVKEALKSNYFEKLIEKYILNNSHSSLLMVKPKKGLGEEKERELKEKLKEYKEKLSPEELNKIIDETKKLKERQMSSDSPEDLKKIPLLSIEDIDRKTEELPLEIIDESGIKVLKHNLFTNKIAYVNLYFNTTVVPQELIPYVGLLSSVLGKVSTEKYSYEELSNEVNIHTGGIYYSATAYSDSKNPDQFIPMMKVKSKALIGKLPEMFELLGEEISGSKFDDYKRINEIISELKSRMEMTIFDRGHMVTAARLASYFSPVANYLEGVTGLTFYHFIMELENNFQSKKEDIVNKLKEVSKLIFNKENLIVSVALQEDEYKYFKDNFSVLYNKLGSRDLQYFEYYFNLNPENEGLMTSGKVQFNAKGYNYKKLGYEYTGAMQVLKTIISYDYLWNNVRVQGGAYGCFGGFNRNGNMYFVSYRDPNLKDTLKVYDGAVKYIESFDTDEREMTKYIIGTISDIDSPLSPSMKADKAAANYFSNITIEDLRKEREEIIDSKIVSIRNLANIVDSCMKEQYICVLGGEERIKENKELFNKLVNVFE
ncbi:insulinase family protein [Clostridium lundense]|uniref:insulinase family protein n=1 Tax=Clostridium lundense TaxID=319475 RepID=UPI0004865560|nr:insulinase family protein [Clostridium lundense]